MVGGGVLGQVRQELRVLMDNRAKFVLCHCSTGHRHALKEASSYYYYYYY